MKLRSLRIAWSTTCGLAAVLLICLWVRSYWWLDNVNFSKTRTRVVQSFEGVISLHLRPIFTEPGLTSLPYTEWASPEKRDNHNKALRWYAGQRGSGVALVFPHWFTATLLSVGSVILWLGWRFSLRSLLITTTLVAIVLGLITWATR